MFRVETICWGVKLIFDWGLKLILARASKNWFEVEINFGQGQNKLLGGNFGPNSSESCSIPTLIMVSSSSKKVTITFKDCVFAFVYLCICFFVVVFSE